MDILLTSAGRRNYLLRYFRAALSGKGRVLAADCSRYAPALEEADQAFVVPRVDEAGYIDHLLALCEDQEVGMLLSLNDHELPILAQARERFQAVGIHVVVSSPDVIALCADKLATARFLEGVGLAAPVTFASLERALMGLTDGEVEFPLIVKPRWGTASLGIELVGNPEELRLAWELGLRRLPRLGLRTGGADGAGLIIQGVLPGVEYGLDIVNDLNGTFRASFAKRKLAMRGGETDKAVTDSRPELAAIGRRLGELLGHVGNLDCDVFLDGGVVRVLELNPRFGGGYPFSAEAGVDVPSALLAWAEGRGAPSGWDAFCDGVASAKCDRMVRLSTQPRGDERVPGQQEAGELARG